MAGLLFQYDYRLGEKKNCELFSQRLSYGELYDLNVVKAYSFSNNSLQLYPKNLPCYFILSPSKRREEKKIHLGKLQRPIYHSPNVREGEQMIHNDSN